jgi:membrane-associated phospholipid phosphatase
MVLTATKDKISMHSMGMGALVSTMLVLPKFSIHDLTTPFLSVLIIAGLIGSSRLYLQAHTLRQVYMGYVVGFLVQSLVFIF